MIDDWDEVMNHTELVELARFNDIPGASKAASREELIESIHEMKPVETENPIDGLRNRMSKWLKRYWDVFRSQVTHEECPECHKCCDLRVIDCYLSNEDQIR
jgi:aminoglycoside phosphotransferase family enzyme